MDINEIYDSYSYVLLNGTPPKIMIIDRKFWDELGLESTETVEFDGFLHLIYRGNNGCILLPQCELTTDAGLSPAT